MPPTMYLVNPASDFATYFSAEVMAAKGLPAGAFMADLPTAILAALAPNDFKIRDLRREHIRYQLLPTG